MLYFDMHRLKRCIIFLDSFDKEKLHYCMYVDIYVRLIVLNIHSSNEPFY